MRVNFLKEFYEAYAWIGINGKNSKAFNEEHSAEQLLEFSYISQFGRYGLIEPCHPVLFISRSNKRIRGVMLGWPVGRREKGNRLPRLDPNGKAFYIHFLRMGKKSKKQAMAEFDLDILESAPQARVVFYYDWKKENPSLNVVRIRGVASSGGSDGV